MPGYQNWKTVTIAIEARDNASAVFSGVNANLSRLGGVNVGPLAGAEVHLRAITHAAHFATDALGAMTAAARGNYDEFNKFMGELPRGLGSLYKAEYEVIGYVTGWSKELADIAKASSAAAKEMADLSAGRNDLAEMKRQQKYKIALAAAGDDEILKARLEAEKKYDEDKDRIAKDKAKFGILANAYQPEFDAALAGAAEERDAKIAEAQSKRARERTNATREALQEMYDALDIQGRNDVEQAIGQAERQARSMRARLAPAGREGFADEWFSREKSRIIQENAEREAEVIAEARSRAQAAVDGGLKSQEARELAATDAHYAQLRKAWKGHADVLAALQDSWMEERAAIQQRFARETETVETTQDAYRSAAHTLRARGGAQLLEARFLTRAPGDDPVRTTNTILGQLGKTLVKIEQNTGNSGGATVRVAETS
jgi:hypothetical protein